MHEPPHGERVDAIAIAMPQLNPAGDGVGSWSVVLGQRFWGQTPEKRHLTLLHESIHLRLFAERQARTIRNDSVRRRLLAAADEARQKEAPDRADFKRQRGVAAMQFHLFPDEMWAELFVRDHYPDWLERRLTALVEMRERTRAERDAQLARMPQPLHPWWAVHELIRVSLVIALESDERRMARLEALKAACISDLEQESSSSVQSTIRSALDAVPKPLTVDAVSEARFDEFCDAVLTVSPY
jgi:hypothetical protein